VGIPPEFIGLGRFLASLTEKERNLVEKYYLTLKEDIVLAGHYLNKDNLRILAKESKGWEQIAKDVSLTEKYLGENLGPKTQAHHLHKNLSSNVWLLRSQPEKLTELITETGILRKSLG
jgi:phosphoenolpyruvate carboxylase